MTVAEEVNRLLTEIGDPRGPSMRIRRVLTRLIEEREAVRQRQGSSVGNFADVVRCYRKFGFPLPGRPLVLEDTASLLRLRHLMEEIGELTEGLYTRDLVKQADALVDIVYIAMGTAAMMGLPWEALWMEVHRANWTKERAASAELSKRKSALDLVKPAGWRPPDLARILEG